ncbi:MAG: hypothetical protein IPJ94_30720 [Chloroflexi bacterium]|nr:hypothetical protein [Chloroflexota bacterium]
MLKKINPFRIGRDQLGHFFVGKLMKQIGHLRARHAADDGFQRFQGKLAPNHRGHLQQVAAGRRQTVQSGQQQPVDGVWDL